MISPPQLTRRACLTELLDTARAEVILGRIMAVSGDLSAALEQMQKARDMYAETTMLAGTKIFLDPHALGQVLSELGLLFSKAAQGERAIDCLQQAEKISFAADDVGGLSAHRRTLALLLAKHGDDSQQALDKLRLSQESCKKLANNAGVAEGTLVHGQIAGLQSNQAVSVQKIKLAVDMFRDSQDRSNLGRALCLLAAASGVSPMGVVQIQDGLDIYKETLDRIGEAEALQQMAELESALSNPAAACKNWLECLDVKRANGDIKGAKTCLAQLLIEYEKLNDAKRMLDYGAQLNEMARQSDDVDKASHALLYIGESRATHTLLLAHPYPWGQKRSFAAIRERVLPTASRMIDPGSSCASIACSSLMAVFLYFMLTWRGCPRTLPKCRQGSHPTQIRGRRHRGTLCRSAALRDSPELVQGGQSCGRVSRVPVAVLPPSGMVARMLSLVSCRR